MKKYYILDTNVILHDYRSIFNFEENNIVIPITVLEELDRFKKGNDLINFHAREFVRELNKLSEDSIFRTGASLGKNKGKIFIETGKSFSEKLINSFPENTPDHRILAIADYLLTKKKSHKVILVTKDINLRMKAKSIGLPAEDYKSDQVADIEDVLQQGVRTFENFDPKIIKQLYAEPYSISAKEFKPNNSLKGNLYFILKNNKSSVLAHYDPLYAVIERVEKRNAYGIQPRNAEQAFALHALMDDDISLVSLTGKAGTGKTLLALAAAIELEEKFDFIYLARPIVALSSKDLGYLPGDAGEKIGPYMQPLFDNLAVIKRSHSPFSKTFQRIDDMIKDEKLIITPIAYIRGRSLANVFFIVDEAQNLTPHEIKTIITRAGENTKMVFTGDIEQIDSPYLDKKSNGLSYLSDKMAGQDIFAHVNLIKGERSYLAELASNLL